MRAALHAVIAALLAEPGHVRLRDLAAWWATGHVPGVRALRSRRAERRERPGWRPGGWG